MGGTLTGTKEQGSQEEQVSCSQHNQKRAPEPCVHQVGQERLNNNQVHKKPIQREGSEGIETSVGPASSADNSTV